MLKSLYVKCLLVKEVRFLKNTKILHLPKSSPNRGGRYGTRHFYMCHTQYSKKDWTSINNRCQEATYTRNCSTTDATRPSTRLNQLFL